MIEVVWQYDPRSGREERQPEAAAEARQILEAGNAAFAALAGSDAATARHIVRLYAADLGIGERPGEAPAQRPFAAVLSCADARVPPELIFGQAANDLFVVRVAGHVLGAECLGSFDYAVAHLHSVRQLTVLGHTGCGAVGATVEAYLKPQGYLDIAVLPALRTIVDGLMAAVHGAAASLASVYGAAAATRPGYKVALTELAVCLNAALVAHLLGRAFADQLGPRLAVAYGVYNLATRQVGLPGPTAAWAPGLVAPPADDASFQALAAGLARSPWLAAQLDGASAQPAAGH